jgi:glycosyltransferase involved in cell wall biosynthesis
MSRLDVEQLALSGLVDEAEYRVRASLPGDADAVAHYLEHGWLQGLDPHAGFDGAFLRPYYEAAGRHGPPALTWLDLSVLPGRRPPISRAEVEPLADLFRTHPLFDSFQYAERLGGALDPATHYAVVGELLGWSPSPGFDPAFYLERYEDIARSGMSPLEHYILAGQREGRRVMPFARRLAFPPLPDRRKPSVLVVVHEASRTGAPLIGRDIARRLGESYNVVIVLMRGGTLVAQFASVCAVTVGPLAGEDWHCAELRRLAERLVAIYAPLYVIANSVETAPIVPALAGLDIPVIALVHEFPANTRPVGKMWDVLCWAAHVVFPAELVARAAYDAFPGLRSRRGVHIMPQGPLALPETGDADSAGELCHRVRPDDAGDAFIVLGCGYVDIRKGVDLFIATAASARRLAPDLRLRFVWIGAGYDPANDRAYSNYLAEQIVRSGLGETVAFLGAVDHPQPAYAQADLFFLSSRLDPQPNVCVDAVISGVPTLCFEAACGTAEILSADPATRTLVVAHLDVHAAAGAICRLARDPAALAAVRAATLRVGRAAFDMEAYLAGIDGWGRAAATALQAEDLRILADARAVDADLALPPDAPVPGTLGAERHVLRQWMIWGTGIIETFNPNCRRPCAGFHPAAYAQAHPDTCGEGGANPLAHWVRAGRPRGRWSHQVFSPLDPLPGAGPALRLALHAHLYYVSNAPELAARLASSDTRCDLFLSTDTDGKAANLRAAFAGHKGLVEIRVMANRGRDIAPFLTGFARQIDSGRYDVFGHVHSKQRPWLGQATANSWRDFLWENLIGGPWPMLDLAAAAFAAHPDLGLLMAEDPHLVGWDRNRAIAEALHTRMGGEAGTLDDFFDFPVGNMFWARPAALRPLLDLGLTWEDYPAEPVGDDGTLLHALERLTPYAARRAALRVGGLRAPGTTW